MKDVRCFETKSAMIIHFTIRELSTECLPSAKIIPWPSSGSMYINGNYVCYFSKCNNLFLCIFTIRREYLDIPVCEEKLGFGSFFFCRKCNLPLN